MILADDPGARAQLLATYRQHAGLDDASLSAGERSLFATADRPRFPGAVLPGPSASGDARQRLYALADSGPQWRQLAPLLRACVGVTITDFVGRTALLDRADPFEAWLAESGLFVGRLTAGPDVDGQAPRQLVQALDRMLERSDAPGRGVPRSNDDVLNALSVALAAGQREAAYAEIEFLRTNWRMDALNLRFLEVRVDAELRDWQSLMARPWFADLCRTRRPGPVTAALLQAIYHTSVAPVERDHGPRAALDLFRTTIHGRVGTLLQAPPAVLSRPVATLFALAALAAEPPDGQALALLDDATTRWDDDDRAAFRALVRELLPLSPSGTTSRPEVEPPSPDPAQTATQDRVEQPRTFSWAATLVELRALQEDPELPTVERARSAILGAVELNDVEASGMATAYVDRLTDDDRATLLTSRLIAAQWEVLLRLSGEGQPPATWHEWLTLLPTVSAETARTWAERAAVEWPVGEQLRSAHDTVALADAFEAVGVGADPGLVRQLERRRDAALVHLFGWLQRDPAWPNPEYLELYDRLVYLLALSPGRSPATLAVLTELVRGMLQVGLPSSAYQATLGVLADVVRDLDSASYIDQLIDLVEATAESACPAPAARQELWGLVLGVLTQYGSQLADHHRHVLRELAGLLHLRAELEAALPSSRTERPQTPTMAVPAGYQIGVYTLMEGVGSRVKASLERSYPGVVVEVNTSAVSTDGLVNLARRADLFVLGWRTAKHAATDAISAARPASLPTVFPPGKGSSSVLATVREHLMQRPHGNDPPW